MRFNRTERSLFLATAIYGAVLLVFLPGCTAIDMHREPPKDWPKLTVTEHKVGFWELQTICGGSVIAQYVACARIFFKDNACKIYYVSGDEYGRLAVEHEREHCNGRDHVGSSALRDALRDR